jgi:hypothetical protein
MTLTYATTRGVGPPAGGLSDVEPAGDPDVPDPDAVDADARVPAREDDAEPAAAFEGQDPDPHAPTTPWPQPNDATPAMNGRATHAKGILLCDIFDRNVSDKFPTSASSAPIASAAPGFSRDRRDRDGVPRRFMARATSCPHVRPERSRSSNCGRACFLQPWRDVVPAASAVCAEVRSLGPADPLHHAALQGELVHRYLLWDCFVGGSRRLDVLPFVLSRALHEGAVRTALDTVRIVGDVAARAHRDGDERARYRLAPFVHDLARASRMGGDDSLVARVDLLLGADGGWHACEINSDCAGGYNEALGLPRLARSAGFHAGTDPTHATESLVEHLADCAQGGTVGLVYATAYAEDLQVCALLQRRLQAQGARAVLTPATALRRDGDGIAIRAERLRVIYRYLPTEYMEGQHNLEDIARALQAGALRSVTSFAHVYLQSKLAFARAWADLASLDGEDRSFVERALPESLDVLAVAPGELLAHRGQWILKRAYGRVGDQVFVGPLTRDGEWRGLVEQVTQLASTGESWIAQRFVDQSAVPTPWGPRYVTLGAYVLGGRFVGYFARLTPSSHVGHDALCLPVFVEGE